MHKSYDKYNISEIYDERAFAKKGLFGFTNWAFGGAKAGAGTNFARAGFGFLAAWMTVLGWVGTRLLC